MGNFDQTTPNIVFILTDDQGAWALGCYGNKEIHTPNLDRLAKRGIRFDNFFCTSPVCSPARASILTGRIPSQHGIHDWLREGKRAENTEEYLEGQMGYTDLLAQNGYVCGISGKWHLGASIKPQKSFSYWNVHATGGGPYYGAPMVRDGQIIEEARYVTDVITDNAIEFLEERNIDENPFYLSVHYTAPHGPWINDQHPKEWIEFYENCPFKSCPEEPMHPWQINTASYGTVERRREILKGYYATVSAMDKNVGRILDQLEDMRITENTLIIFTSDNGMNMGHHGVYGKGNGTFPQNMYDTSVKVPMIISHPNHITEGIVCQNILSHYDVMPTILEYIGLENPEEDSLPGKSFVNVLRGIGEKEQDTVVVFDEYGPVRMIRDHKWKYIHRYPHGPHELYDLENDPDEKNNLYGDQSKEKVIGQMKKQLELWFIRYVNPQIDGAKEGVYGKGQLDFAGLWGEKPKTYADDWRYLGEVNS